MKIQMINKEIIILNKKIFYRTIGSGNLVMLVHGFGETGDVWKNQVDFLKDKFQLIIPDLPGSGKSEMIDDMSMEGLAEILKNIIDKESSHAPPSGGWGVIGHSMGGYVALAFAEKYPQYLNKFGLFHSTAFADSEEKKATRRKGIEFIKEHGPYEFLKNTTPNLFSPKTKAENQPLIDDFIKGLNNFSAQSLVSYHEAMMKRPDRTEVLKNSTIPVLFIMGKYDTAVPMADNLKLCSLPEMAYIDILKNSGHMGMLEEPGSSKIILEKFLD